MGALFKQKVAWIGLIAIPVIIVILSFANLGSTVSPTPKDMPVVLVNLDKGAIVPGKGEMNFGKMMEEKMTAEVMPNGQESPLVWTKMDSEQAAIDALDHEQFYAAVVLPADMTGKLLSLQSPKPQPGEAKVLLNQGMNYTGATATGTILDKVMAAVNGQLREQMLAGIKGRGDVLNTAQASALAAPLVVKQEIHNPVGTQSANGNAPVVLSQMLWIIAFLGTVILWFAAGQAVKAGARPFPMIFGRLIGGVLVVVPAVLIMMLIAIGVLDLEVPDFWEMTFFLMFAGYAFFLLQTMLYSWLGLRGTPVVVMMFFFSLPVLALPEQFLPAVTRDWFLSWVPLRFAADAIRDLLYFGQGLNLSTPAWTLAAIGAGGLVLTLLSGFKKPKAAVKTEAQLSR
ncbi:MAG: ABC transporter permease [Tumebacillaceae bacterium]